MIKLYNYVYATIYKFFNFTEELTGGKSSTLKTNIFLTLIASLNFMGLNYILESYFSNPITKYLRENTLPTVIIIYLFFMLIHVSYSKSSIVLLNINLVDKSVHSKRKGIIITIFYLILSIIIIFS